MTILAWELNLNQQAKSEYVIIFFQKKIQNLKNYPARGATFNVNGRKL